VRHHIRINATAHVCPEVGTPHAEGAIVIARRGNGFEETFGAIGAAIVARDGETNADCLRRHGLHHDRPTMSLKIMVRDAPEEAK